MLDALLQKLQVSKFSVGMFSDCENLLQNFTLYDIGAYEPPRKKERWTSVHILYFKMRRIRIITYSC